MNAEQLSETASQIVSKTILAADESGGTIEKKFRTINVESTLENRQGYRQLLFKTRGIEQFVSGVILFDETIRQSTDAGTPFPQLLSGKDIVPGIKVDAGTVGMPGMGPDKFTQGLDGLGKRLAEYRDMGAKFAKWRAVIAISNNNDGNFPTIATVQRNAHDLALYAALCQDNGLVPIVEPEVLMDGSHSAEDCSNITEWVLTEVFGRLRDYNVSLSGMILKPNMVTSGSKADHQANPQAVAQATLDALRRTVSYEVPGIAFLSGGQSPDLATTHLNEINKLKNEQPKEYPWRLTASFGRALQEKALKAWNGDPKNIIAAQTALLDRAEKVFLASNGQL